MNVISGIYKGLKLKGFDIDGTRPTMARVKESLFSMIQNEVKDSIVLDLFAGSGSLGIEALSMGALKATFIDKNKIAINILKENTKKIKNAYIINSDYEAFLNNTKETFDIIILDPPYKDNLINKAIKLIEEHDLLNKNGLIICEYEKEEFNCSYEIIKEKKYGDKNIRIYKK